jgi:hypothetical protein
MDTPRSDAAGAEGDKALASKVEVEVESPSTTVEETDPCRRRRRFVVNGEIFNAVSLLFLLSIIEEDTGLVALPLKFGVKATTAAGSIATTSEASVRAAAENNFLFVSPFLFIQTKLLLLFLAALSASRARRDLFFLVSIITSSTLC